MASISGNINIQVKNNLDREANFSLLGGVQDPTNGQANATTLYEWDLSTEPFVNKEAVQIQARNVENNDLITYTVENPEGEITNAQTVVDLLNTLLIGEFNVKDNTTVWIINDLNVYGDLTVAIQPNFQASQFVIDAYNYFNPQAINLQTELEFTTLYQGIFDYAIANISNFVNNILGSGYGLCYPFVGDTLKITNDEGQNPVDIFIISENNNLPNNYLITQRTIQVESVEDLDSIMTFQGAINSANLLYVNGGIGQAQMLDVQLGINENNLTNVNQIPLLYTSIFNGLITPQDFRVQFLAGQYLNLGTLFGEQGTSQGNSGYPYYYTDPPKNKTLNVTVEGENSALGITNVRALGNWDSDFFQVAIENNVDVIIRAKSPVSLPSDTFQFNNPNIGNGQKTFNFDSLANGTGGLYEPSPTGGVSNIELILNVGFVNVSILGIGGIQSQNTAVILEAKQTSGGALPQSTDFALSGLGNSLNYADKTQLALVPTDLYPLFDNRGDQVGFDNLLIRVNSNVYPDGQMPSFLFNYTVYKYTDRFDPSFQNQSIVWSQGTETGEDSTISYGTRLMDALGISLFYGLQLGYAGAITPESNLDIRNNSLPHQMTIVGKGAGITRAVGITSDAGYIPNENIYLGVIANLGFAVECQISTYTFSDPVTLSPIGEYQDGDGAITPVTTGGTQSLIIPQMVGKRRDLAINITATNDITQIKIGLDGSGGALNQYDVFDACVIGTQAPYEWEISSVVKPQILISGLTINSPTVNQSNISSLNAPYLAGASFYYYTLGSYSFSLGGLKNFDLIELQYIKLNTGLTGIGDGGFNGLPRNDGGGYFNFPEQSVGEQSVGIVLDYEQGRAIENFEWGITGRAGDYSNTPIDTIFGLQGNLNNFKLSQGLPVVRAFQMKTGTIQMGMSTVADSTLKLFLTPLLSGGNNFFSGDGGSTGTYNINTSFQDITFSNQNWIDFATATRTGTSPSFTIEINSGQSSINSFSWGKEFKNLVNIASINFQTDALFTTQSYGGGNLVVDSMPDLIQLQLSSAKADGIFINNCNALTSINIGNNSLPSSEPTNNTGLSEIIVEIESYGTSNGTLNYANQTTGAVPDIAICGTAYNDLISRGWTITGNAPAIPTTNIQSNTLTFVNNGNAGSFGTTTGFDVYNPENPLPSKTYTIEEGATVDDSVFYYPNALLEYTADTDVALTLPSWVTETGRKLIEVEFTPIDGGNTVFYTAIKIDFQITGNAIATSDNFTATHTTQAITINIVTNRAKYGAGGSYSGSITPNTFGLVGTYTPFNTGIVNVTDTTTLTVTGGTGTLNSITATPNDITLTGSDIITLDSVVGLPATVGQTFTATLLLSIPNQRKSRNINSNSAFLGGQALLVTGTGT